MVGAGLCGLVACGPYLYVDTVTINGNRELKEAAALRAERLAPYEYWAAVEYLHMAKEKGAFADFQLAVKYGEKAVGMARDAKRLSLTRARDQPVQNDREGPETKAVAPGVSQSDDSI